LAPSRKALDERRRDLDHGFGTAHFFLGPTYTEEGRYEEALQALETVIRLSGRYPDLLAALGYLRGVFGQIDSTRSVFDELIRLANDPDSAVTRRKPHRNITGT
jgi:cytochrome c-type biogenesis protein CcmH/NrfG